MKELLQSIAQNPLVTVISLLLGLCGVILAVVFYLKSRRFKALLYLVSGRTIVEDLTAELDGLEVRYQQVPQQRVTVSRLSVWNGGTDTLTSSDLTSADPFRIEFGRDANLLDSRIIFQTEQANQLTLGTPELPSNDDEEIRLNIFFDYLDRSDGATIQLVHTGPRFHPIRLKGKIKGTQVIKRMVSPPYHGFRGPLRTLAASKLFGWFGVLFYIAACVASVAGFARNYSRWYLLPLAAFALFGSWVMFFGYARRSIPAKFKDAVD